MRTALIGRLEALRDAYAAMALPELAERVSAARHAVFRTVDPGVIRTITVDLARAIDASCITPAAQLADGLIEIGCAFGALAAGIAEQRPVSWRRGCCRQAIDAAREMAKRDAAAVRS